MFNQQFNLSKQLLKSILTIYFIITFIITIIHLSVVYQYTKNNINSELKQIAKTFEPALQTALWELNYEQLRAIVDGMMQIPLIYGVELTDSSDKIIIKKFHIPISEKEIENLEYFHQFNIHHQMNNNDIYLALVKVYSDDKAVYERLKVSYLMIILNAFLKTTVLIVLFIIAFRKYLELPLQSLTNTIVNLRVKNIDKKQISLNMKYDNELRILQEEFNKLLEKISNDEIERLELLHGINEKLEYEVKKRTKELENIAITDRLTQLYNRTKMDIEIQNMYEMYQRYRRTFSLIMIDIDYFKVVNDTYGHQVGDSVLKKLALILQEHVRKTDLVGRWGGEEFLIACPETSQTDALKLAEKLRNEVALFLFDKIGHKTISLGVAQIQEGLALDNLIDNSDKALYQAKKSGRNKVVLFSELSLEE